MKRFGLFLCALLAGALVIGSVPAQEVQAQAPHRVAIYLFWGDGCPHCAKAKPFLEDIANKTDGVELYKYEVYYNAHNQQLYQEVGEALDIHASGVPLIIIGDEPFVGYSESSAGMINERVEACRTSSCPDSVARIVGVAAPSNSPSLQTKTDKTEIELPFFGTVHIKDFSLPILTIIIAALDGFNPCAMWVLLFLISVLLGMQNRRRMWALGGSFIAASAIVYLLFMTAWLSIFTFIGYVVWVKLLIGFVALGAGGYYLYDFFHNKNGGCNVTGESRREAILQKVRSLAHERRFWLALVGVVGLAFAVNLIELVCSAGLPAIYTSVLATSGLEWWQRGLYLALYIIIFMADDLFVFFVAMFTLKITGLQSKYARVAHLVGGILMLILGTLLIFAPQLLMFG